MFENRNTHDRMVAKMLADPEIKKAYDDMSEEFDLLRARLEAGKTQEEVAQLMHTKKSAISRLESGKGKHSPSLYTLKKYAEALGCELKVQLVPKLNF